MPDDQPGDWYDPGEVKPRDRMVNPRCHTCRTGPMYHPQHKFGPCWVVLPSGDQCGCTAGKPAPAD